MQEGVFIAYQHLFTAVPCMTDSFITFCLFVGVYMFLYTCICVFFAVKTPMDVFMFLRSSHINFYFFAGGGYQLE